MKRSIDGWLDNFCYKHPKLGIPNLMLIIVLGTAVVFILDMFSGFGYSFSSLLSFNPYAILHGQIWRLITFVFVPSDHRIFFLAISLYFYWFIGSALEQEWGTVKFTVFYAVGLLLNIVMGFVLYFIFPTTGATATMQYVNLSLFFAFATLYPNLQMLLFFIIPVKVKWLAWVDAAIFAWGIIGSLLARNFIFALLPIIAVLNYVLFFWSDIMALLGRAKQRTSRQTVNFKQATRRAQQQKGYLHKCAVCGKTDTDYPNMEFRYCSKCNGYYCYCMEHINNHVHIE